MQSEIKKRVGARQKTLWRGTVYWQNRSFSADCIVRDFSETGARLTIVLPAGSTLPDKVELYVPQKSIAETASVIWRRGDEVGVQFHTGRGEPNQVIDDLLIRVKQLEIEV